MAWNWIKFENSYVRADQIAEMFVDENLGSDSDNAWDAGIRFNCGGITYIKSFPTKEEGKAYVDKLFNSVVKPVLNYTKVYNAEVLK